MQLSRGGEALIRGSRWCKCEQSFVWTMQRRHGMRVSMLFLVSRVLRG